MAVMTTRLGFVFLIAMAGGIVCPPFLYITSALAEEHQSVGSSDAAPVDWHPTAAELRQVQERLHVLGFDPGPADGLMGQQTTAALQAYQRSVNQSEDGKLTLELYQRLTADPDSAAMSAGQPLGETEDSAEVRCAPTLGGAWRFEDEQGSSFVLALHPDGRVAGTSYPHHWRWHATAREIEITYDNGMGTTVSRVGQLRNGDVLLGDAKDSRGRVWVWKAVRLPSEPDSDQDLCAQDKTP